MAETDSAAAERYDLFTVQGPQRIRLKLHDHGISLTEGRLAWQSERGELWANLTEISSLRVQIGQVGGKQIGSCIIGFRKGPQLSVTSADGWGKGDSERAQLYRRFLADLHQRLAALPAGSIEFAAGATQKQQTLGVVATVVAIAFFVCLPLVLLMITGDAEALYPLIGGALFVYPLLRVLQKNKPRSYNPRAVPGELLP